VVDTRSRQDTLIERFESLDAIWPERANYSRVATRSLGADDVLTTEPGTAVEFLRRHSWTLGGLVVLVTSIAWLIGVGAPALDARLAESTLSDYDRALVAIDSSIFDARQALAVLTDPGSDSADLSESLENMTPFVSATSFARTAVAAALPETPPLVPRTRIEAVVPTRISVAGVADQAEAVADRLGTLLTYRLLADGLFVLPHLPTVADGDAVETLSVEIAAALAASVEAAVSLPTDPLLETHRRAVTDTLGRLEALRGDYLAALRAEDEAGAAAIVAEVDAALAAVTDTLGTSLGDVEDWGARELDLLRVATLEARQLTS
jgi:hypothetical protein